MLQEILQHPNASKSADLHFASVADTETALVDFDATEKLGKSVSISGRNLDAGLYHPELKGVPIFVITPTSEMRDFLSRTRRDLTGHLVELSSLLPAWALRVSPDKASFLEKALSSVHQIGVAWIIAIVGPITLLLIGLYFSYRHHISVFNVSTRP